MADVKFSAQTEKTTLVGTDQFPIIDSESGPVTSKRTLFSTIISSVFAGIAGLTGKTTPVDADTLIISDSAASNVGKSLTWANLKATLKTYFDTLYVLTGRLTSPVAWTPASNQGVGTLGASNVRSWRVGGHLFFDGVLTLGTTTAAEMRITLGFNGTSGNVTTASTIGTLETCGIAASGANGGRAAYCLAEASKTYITFGWADLGVTNTLNKINGNNFNTGSTLSIHGFVAIDGWS